MPVSHLLLNVQTIYQVVFKHMLLLQYCGTVACLQAMDGCMGLCHVTRT